jgi:flagellar basal body-associated protein FliL
MGCLASVAALLALAMPAAVARASLIGAYVLIVLFTAAAVGAVVWNARRQASAATRPARRTATAITRIGTVAAVYAVAVTIVHVTG